MKFCMSSLETNYYTKKLVFVVFMLTNSSLCQIKPETIKLVFAVCMLTNSSLCQIKPETIKLVILTL
jgi:hypothetical protein